MVEKLICWCRYGQKPINETSLLVDIPFALIKIPRITVTLGAYVGLRVLDFRVQAGDGQVRRREYVRMMGRWHDRLMVCYFLFPLKYLGSWGCCYRVTLTARALLSPTTHSPIDTEYSWQGLALI